MATTSDVSVGAFLRYNGELVQVIEWQHRTPGNLRAFYQAKMRNVRSGKLVENRFRSGENVDLARVETKELQYLYKDGNNLVCMDQETFEQLYVDEQFFGSAAPFMKEEMIVQVAFESDQPVYAAAPSSVELEITYTEPGVKGDTATNAMKPATVETGAEIQVPLFVNIGDVVKIDPNTGAYLERAKG